MGLNLIKKPDQREQKGELISTHSEVLISTDKSEKHTLVLKCLVQIKLMKRRIESWLLVVCGLGWWYFYKCRLQRETACCYSHTVSQSDVISPDEDVRVMNIIFLIWQGVKSLIGDKRVAAITTTISQISEFNNFWCTQYKTYRAYSPADVFEEVIVDLRKRFHLFAKLWDTLKQKRGHFISSQVFGIVPGSVGAGE